MHTKKLKVNKQYHTVNTDYRVNGTDDKYCRKSVGRISTSGWTGQGRLHREGKKWCRAQSALNICTLSDIHCFQGREPYITTLETLNEKILPHILLAGGPDERDWIQHLTLSFSCQWTNSMRVSHPNSGQRSWLCVWLCVCVCVCGCVHEFTGTLIKTANILMANYYLPSTSLSILPTFIHLIFTTTLWGWLHYPQFLVGKTKVPGV